MTSTALQQALAEIQQPRSEYQLQHFVVNQHDTEPQRYRQCLIEIQAISYTLRTVKLELRKTALEIARLRASGDEINEIEAQIKEVASLGIGPLIRRSNQIRMNLFVRSLIWIHKVVENHQEVE